MRARLSRGFLSANPVLHLIERVLSRIEQSLVEIPEVVPFNTISFIGVCVVNMRVQLIVSDYLKEVLDSPLNLYIF